MPKSINYFLKVRIIKPYFFGSLQVVLPIGFGSDIDSKLTNFITYSNSTKIISIVLTIRAFNAGTWIVKNPPTITISMT